MIFYSAEAEKEWHDILKVNSDEYGKLVTDYAKSYAELLEKRMNEGRELADVWKSSLFEADHASQQSGYSASVAHNIVAKVWLHGEEFANLATEMYPHYANKVWKEFFSNRKKE